MDALFRFLGVVVVSVVGLIALVLILIVVVSYLPGSPLKDVLTALAKRLGVTAGVALAAAPLAPIEPLGGIYDVLALVFLVVYWFAIFEEIGAISRKAPQPRATSSQPGGVYDVTGKNLLTTIPTPEPRVFADSPQGPRSDG